MRKEANEILKDLKDFTSRQSKCEKMDEMAFNHLATYLHVYFENRDEVIKSGGSVQIYQSGASSVSGHFMAMNKASDYIEKLCFKMGIYETIKTKLTAYGRFTEEVGNRVK